MEAGGVILVQVPRYRHLTWLPHDNVEVTKPGPLYPIGKGFSKVGISGVFSPGTALSTFLQSSVDFLVVGFRGPTTRWVQDLSSLHGS